MKITKSLIVTVFNLVLIYMSTLLWKMPEEIYVDAGNNFIFSKGNAPETVRSEVMQQLKRFQEGYTKRDVSKVDKFAEQLLSKDNIVIIGTGGLHETCIGYEEAASLIETDWEEWGDCRFLMDNAQISAFGDTAWFSTIGTVKGSYNLMSYFFALQVSGVLVRENGTWKFQQMQFQSIPNLNWIIIVQGLLMLWFAVNLFILGYRIYHRIRNWHNDNKAIEVTE